MALRSNTAASSYVTIPNIPELNFPANEWTVCFNFRPDNVVSFGYCSSWGNYATTPSFNIYRSGVASTFLGRFIDDSGNSIAMEGANSVTGPTTLGQWIRIGLRFENGTLTAYNTGVLIRTATNASFGAITRTTDFFFGARSDGTLRQNAGYAEFAKWDRALPVRDIVAIGKGKAPDHFPRKLALYQTMRRDSGITLRNGTASITSHPRVTKADLGIIANLPPVASGSEGAAMYHHLQNIGAY